MFPTAAVMEFECNLLKSEVNTQPGFHSQSDDNNSLKNDYITHHISHLSSLNGADYQPNY